MIGSAEIGRVEVEKVAMPVGHAAGAGPIIVPGLFGNLSIRNTAMPAFGLCLRQHGPRASSTGAVLPKLIVEPRIEPEIVFGLSRDG